MSYSFNAFGASPATAQAPQLLSSLNSRWAQMAPVKGIGLSLASLGTMLHALLLLHQSAHWQVRGPTYYGDHLLFQRIYEGIAKEIDYHRVTFRKTREDAPQYRYVDLLGSVDDQFHWHVHACLVEKDLRHHFLSGVGI